MDSFVVMIYIIEGAACGLHWQCGDVKNLGVGRNGGDPGSDVKTNVVELTQFLHHGIELLGVYSLQVEDVFSTVEDYDHLP